MKQNKFVSLLMISVFIFGVFAISSVSAQPQARVYAPPCGTPNGGPCGGSGGAQTVPWGITRVNGDAAQGQVDETGVIVAVLDTGLDITHEDLQGVATWGYSFYKGNHEISGHECTLIDWSYCDDGHGHGTHVTGTIAAQDNSLGVLGVAPDVTVYTVKVLSNRGSGSYAAIANGIRIATNGPDGIVGTADDANVISMSLGGPSGTADLQNAVNYALSHDVVVVCATGNDGASSPSYPAAYSGVLKVGAIDSSNTIASFSNRGEDVFAPGVDVLSTLPGNSYASWAGTSMATPHVSGVVALAWAAHPSYSGVQIYNLVVGSTDGYNVVNALAVI